MQNGGASGIPPGENGAQSHIHDGVVTVNLSDIADLARCPVCMGILKDTRTISVCMHRFCRTCIEAWLRTNIDNTCPQCRESFASRRNCKPDPTFDQLLKAIFGADTTTADDAFLEPPSNALAAAKTIGNELELLREAQRVASGKVASLHTAVHNQNSSIVPVHVSTTTPAVTLTREPSQLPQNGKYYSGDITMNINSGSLLVNPASELKGKAKYKKRAAPAAADGVGAALDNSKMKKFKKKANGEEVEYRYSEDTTTTNTTTTSRDTTPTTATAGVVLERGASANSGLPITFQSPYKNDPGTPSTKYFGVRKYYTSGGTGTGTSGSTRQPWYLAYYQDGTSMYTPLGQYSTETEAARIHDIHTLRMKGIHPKKSVPNLNFPYLSTIYVRLLAHGIAPGATAGEYENASAKITAAVQGVGSPPGWRPPLEKKINENEKSKYNKGGYVGSRPPSSASGGGGGGKGPTGGLAGTGGLPKMKKVKVAPSSTAGGFAPQGGSFGGVKQRETEESEYIDGYVAEEIDVGALRAQELAKRFPSLNMIGPNSGRPASVVVELRPADGLSLVKTWNKNWITCPGDALVSGIASAIADGINKGEMLSIKTTENKFSGGGGGGSIGGVKMEPVLSSSIYLAAANELDASADFMAVYREVEGSGGMLALTPTMQIRDLVLLLAECGEDLILEYSIN